MSQQKETRTAKLLTGLTYWLLTLGSSLLCGWAVFHQINRGSPADFLPETTPSGVRLLVFAFGMLLSWLLGRWALRTLVEGRVPVGDSTGSALSVLALLALSALYIAVHIGHAPWAVLGLGFLLLYGLSVPKFWKLIGAGPTLATAFTAVLVLSATYYLTRL